MDLAERNRLIAVTKGFQCLQGLLYAPMGMLMLAFSLLRKGFTPPDSTPARDWAALALLMCAVAATQAAKSYYRRRFGVVRSKYQGVLYTLSLVAGGITGLAVFGVSLFDNTRLGASHPVSLTCLSWALFYVACYLQPYRVRPHSLWFAALFLGLGVLTLTGVVPKNQFLLLSGQAGDLLIWLAFSLHGFLDHLLLLRLFPKASPEPSTEQSTERHA